MKCLDCKNWNLRGSNSQMRKAGWAPCSASAFMFERWHGTTERESCQPGSFELTDAETIAARKKYLGIEDG